QLLIIPYLRSGDEPKASRLRWSFWVLNNSSHPLSHPGFTAKEWISRCVPCDRGDANEKTRAKSAADDRMSRGGVPRQDRSAVCLRSARLHDALVTTAPMLRRLLASEVTLRRAPIPTPALDCGRRSR